MTGVGECFGSPEESRTCYVGVRFLLTHVADVVSRYLQIFTNAIGMCHMGRMVNMAVMLQKLWRRFAKASPNLQEWKSWGGWLRRTNNRRNGL